jgi:hypothetical protein
MWENYRIVAYIIAIIFNGSTAGYFFIIRNRLAYSLAFTMVTLCTVAFALLLLLWRMLGPGSIDPEFRGAMLTIVATMLVIAPIWLAYEFQRRKNNA